MENYPDYLGCCNALDNAVGRVNTKLEELGLSDDTLIVYTSDHGSHFRTRNSEYKRSCHDGCLRIPMIFKGPGFEGGEVNQNLASLIDIPKTVLAATGADVPADWQGVDVRQTLGKENVREVVFAQLSESHAGRTIRTKKWKYATWLPEAPGGWTEQQHDGEIVYYERFLYDLENDPHERTNLISDPKYADIRLELATILKDKMIEANETEPTILPAL